MVNESNVRINYIMTFLSLYKYFISLQDIKKVKRWRLKRIQWLEKLSDVIFKQPGSLRQTTLIFVVAGIYHLVKPLKKKGSTPTSC